MKFSFINPSPIEELSDRIAGVASWPPLGLLYMATILRDRGMDVSILDQPAKGYTIEDTVNWVKKEDPDFLGFSGYSMSGRTAALTSMEVRKDLHDLPIVMGNLYATFNAERVLRKYPSVDIVARREGEETVVDLVDTLSKGGDLKEVQGITFRQGDVIVSTPDRPLLEDLDALPFPDRSLLDEEYHSEIGGANIAPKKFTSVVSSRGCVHGCRFCSCRAFCRGRWRARSVDNTLEELHYLASEGYNEWICEGRVDSYSYEMLREIARAGCRIIYFGIESANQRILDYYEKTITPQQSVKAVETARKAGIDLVMGTFIVGAPDETREEIQNTLDFAKKLEIDLPQFNALGVHPGMDIWDEMKAKGYVDEEKYWETGVGVSRICPTAVPYPEIVEMIKDAVYDFAMRPGFVLGQIGRTLRSPYRFNVVLNNLGRLGKIRKTLQNPMG
jgi:radical SAM superfamily enzyme YgiQ (UPF0313 family)